MEIFLGIVILAFLVEAVVDTIELLYVEGKIQLPKVLAIVVGVIIAFAVNLDVFTILKVNNNIPIVGVILTGILISRGGNFVNDLFDRLKGSGEIGR